MRGVRDIFVPGGGNGAGGGVAISAVASSVSAGTVVFSNLNGVTFGLNGSTLTASVAAVGGAQTGISGIIVSDATYSSGTVSFSNAGNITIASSVNGATQYIKLSGNAAQTNQSAIKGFGVSNTGATAGNTGISTGIDWVLAGSNLITLSQSTNVGGPNTVWVQHPAWLTTAMLSGASTQFVQANAGFNGTNASGTIASNAISVSVAAPIPIGTNVKAVASVGSTGTITRYAPEDHQHVGVAAFAVTNTGNTAGNTRSQVGTLYLAASGGITASQSTAAAGNDTVWLSVAAPVAQTNQSAIKGLGVSNTGNTLGNTGLSTGIDWVIAASGGVTASESTAGGGPNTVWISVANPVAQTNQSAIKGFGASNTGNTAGNTGISTGIDWVLAGSTNITVSESTTAGGPNTLWLSVPNVAAGNVTFSASANSSALGSVIFANSNNITFGLTTGSQITASFGGGGGVGGGVSTGGNTAGSTGTVTTGNIVFVGSGVISLSQSTGAAGSNATISILAPATSSLVGINGIGISTNGSTISVYPNTISSYENIEFGGMNSIMTFNQTSNLSHAVAFELPQPISASFLRIPVTMSTNSTTVATIASNTATASGAIYSTFNAVIYSMGTGGSSKSLQSVASGSAGFTFSQQISITQSTQYSISQGYSAQANGAGTTRTTQYSISNTNYSFTTNQIATEFSGARMLDINFAQSLTPGPYWLVVGASSSSASAGAALGGMTNCHVRYSGHMGMSGTNLAFGIMGSTDITSGGLLAAGSFSTNAGGTTNSIPISAISSMGSNARIYFQLLRSA